MGTGWVGRAGRVAGKGTGSGEKDADREERRTGIPREPKQNKQNNTENRRRETKQNRQTEKE